MKNVPVDDHGFVNKEDLKEIIDDIVEKKIEITPLLEHKQLESLKKSQKKSFTRKEIFNNLFELIKPNSEFDLLLILKVGYHS